MPYFEKRGKGCGRHVKHVASPSPFLSPPPPPPSPPPPPPPQKLVPCSCLPLCFVRTLSYCSISLAASSWCLWQEEAAMLRRALNESMRRVASLSSEGNVQVDRRIVVKLLVTFFERGQSQEVLQLMARILAFTGIQCCSQSVLGNDFVAITFIGYTILLADDDTAWYCSQAMKVSQITQLILMIYNNTTNNISDIQKPSLSFSGCPGILYLAQHRTAQDGVINAHCLAQNLVDLFALLLCRASAFFQGISLRHDAAKQG